MSLVHINKIIGSVLANSKNVLEISKTEGLIFGGAGGYKPTDKTLAYYTIVPGYGMKDIVRGELLNLSNGCSFNDKRKLRVSKGGYAISSMGTPLNWGTLSLWFYSIGDFNFILFSDANSTDGYMLQIQEQSVSFNNLAGFNGSIYLDQKFQKNRWYNLVLTQDGSTIKLYIDGVYRGVANANKINYSFECIGKYVAYGSYTFHGSISDIIFESSVWSDHDVLVNYGRMDREFNNAKPGVYTPGSSTIFYRTDGSSWYQQNGVRQFNTTRDVIFDGGGYAKFLNNGSYLLPNSPIIFKENKGTINLWYKYERASQTGGWATLFGRNYGSYHHLLIEDGTGAIGFYNADSIHFGNSGYSLSLGRWYNICITYDNGTAKMYINGNFISEKSGMFNLVEQPIRSIGNYWDSGGYQGAIGLRDEVIIEDGVWTTEQIKKRYEASRLRLYYENI